jgi:hypothetical protein
VVSFATLVPQTAGAAAAIWREIRVFKHYIVVGSESYDHHIQIFDLKKLLDIDYREPVTFDPTTDVTGFYGVCLFSLSYPLGTFLTIYYRTSLTAVPTMFSPTATPTLPTSSVPALAPLSAAVA